MQVRASGQKGAERLGRRGRDESTLQNDETIKKLPARKSDGQWVDDGGKRSILCANPPVSRSCALRGRVAHLRKHCRDRVRRAGLFGELVQLFDFTIEYPVSPFIIEGGVIFDKAGNNSMKAPGQR
jgi:hypothetical protein